MLTTILIGAAIGVALTLEILFVHFDVKTKKAAAEHTFAIRALSMRVHELEVEKGRLRIALAARAMTEDWKKIAKIIWEALNAVIDSKQFSEPEPSEGEQPRLSFKKGSCKC